MQRRIDLHWLVKFASGHLLSTRIRLLPPDRAQTAPQNAPPCHSVRENSGFGVDVPVSLLYSPLQSEPM